MSEHSFQSKGNKLSTLTVSGSPHDYLLSWKDGLFTVRKIVTPIPEIVKVTCLSGSLISAGSYFLIDSPSGLFYVWFLKNSQGTDPAITGRTPVMVSVVTSDTANGVAIKLLAALNGSQTGASFTAGTTSGAVATVTCTTGGTINSPLDINSGFTFVVTQVGGDTTVLYNGMPLKNPNAFILDTVLVVNGTAGDVKFMTWAQKFINIPDANNTLIQTVTIIDEQISASLIPVL